MKTAEVEPNPCLFASAAPIPKKTGKGTKTGLDHVKPSIGECAKRKLDFEESGMKLLTIHFNFY